MTRRRSTGAVAATVALGLAACGGGPPSSAGGDSIGAALVGTLSAEDAATAADGVNAFGFELHNAMAEPGTNTVTSPLSAAVLLAMVAAGAGGDTADEMVRVLRLDGPRDTRNAALLADLTGAEGITLSAANSLWAAERHPFEEDYLSFVQDTYGATLAEVDLGTGAAVRKIDDWVAERTEGLIDTIAADLGLPDPSAVLVLLNAVYFLGTWSTAFEEDSTRPGPFTLADGTVVDVPTMHRSAAEVEMVAADGFQMVRLPYGKDKRFGMEVLLPDEDVSLDELLVGLDAESWEQATEGLAPGAVSEVGLPRFELEWDAELGEALQELGMTSAFADGDFLPMSPAAPSLDAVVQKTHIRVDENGTEAAAVTGGAMTTSFPGPQPFLVDRPFVFTVSDSRTGVVLFLGSVHDPRG